MNIKLSKKLERKTRRSRESIASIDAIDAIDTIDTIDTIDAIVSSSPSPSGRAGEGCKVSGRDYKKIAGPLRSLTRGARTSKGGGDLLSRIALQYHRRWRA